MKTVTRPLAAVVASCLVSACASAPDRRDPPLAPATALQPAPGAAWYKLATEPYKGKQDDLVFVDRDVGFYVNGKGKVFRSDDGGAHWDLVFEQRGTFFRAIGMLDATHGFAGNLGTDYFPGVTDDKPLYRTDDGGHHWRAVDGLPGAPVKGLCAIDVLHTRYMNAGTMATRTVVHAAGRVGGPAWLLRSIDGGEHWSTIDMNAQVAMILDVKFFDEMNGVVFAGSDANIERSHAVIVTTNDGGQTWRKAYESSRPGELIWKGFFPSREVGYATVQNDDDDAANVQRYVVKTVDGGRTWRELPLARDHALTEFGVGFANEQLGWVGTTQGGFETRDGGASWHAVDLGRNVNKIRVVPVGGQFVAFAIGSDVYKFAVPPAGAASGVAAAPIAIARP
jgi:photosystem II stability/assembly factor-like uncharacterized protein